MSPYLIKCYNNGTFEINGKTGDEITLPLCDPIGCRPAELGPFNTNFNNIQKPHGCTKGYITVDGVTLEKHNNNCKRQCRENPNILSAKKIKCFCDFNTRACEYVIKLKTKEIKELEKSSGKKRNKNKGIIKGISTKPSWVHWKSTNAKGKRFISTVQCPPPVVVH